MERNKKRIFDRTKNTRWQKMTQSTKKLNGETKTRSSDRLFEISKMAWFFPKNTQKVRTYYLWKLGKKKGWSKLLNVVLEKNFLFFVEKNFFFWLAAGLRSAPLQPSASVPLHSALPPTKKTIFFNKKKIFF